MPLSTYGDLQTTALNWLARPGDSKISASVPDMVTLFENEANRRVRSIYNENGGTLTLTAGDNTARLPSDYLELRSARVSSVTPRRQLEFLSAAQFDGTAVADDTGPPSYFTIDQGLLGPRLRIGPTPDRAYDIAVRYFQRIPALSATVSSNWLLLTYPDAYLFGTLAEAEAFIGHDERIGMWLQRRDGALEAINTSGQKALWGGVPLTIRTDTGNP